MPMPHSKRPRRNRVNKIRAKKGLPPLGELPDVIERSSMPLGVTTLMVPLPAPTRALLTQVRLAAQLKDPSTVASDQLFAGAILTAILPSMVAQPVG